MSEDGLQLQAVVRDYGGDAKVGPVSFTAAPGAFVSLLGPSGCGKTTLLRCIAGFEPLDGGRLLLGSRDISRVPPHRRQIGLVFQSFALFPHLTVAENVAFGLRLRRVARAERQARVAEALRTVGLADHAGRNPSQLSGGQQQRVAIARSLVLNPSLLLLDEPLSNLDYKLRLQMRRELRDLQQRLGMTFVFVTHDQTEALSLSDHVVVLAQGRVAQQGTPGEIYNAPQTKFVADFIGGSNLLPVACIEGTHAGCTLVRLVGGQRILARTPGFETDGSDLWLSIRPETIQVSRAQDGAADSLGELQGRASSVLFMGDYSEVTIELDGGVSVTAHIEPGLTISPLAALRVEAGRAVLVRDC